MYNRCTYYDNHTITMIAYKKKLVMADVLTGDKKLLTLKQPTSPGQL